MIKVIDLFCGIGGLSYGLKKAGLNVVAGFDFDSSCKYAYEANNKAEFVCCDITSIESNDIMKYYVKDDIKVLVGCAPCQTFSSHANKKRDREKDSRWNLLYSFSKHINSIRPEVISMENVPNLVRYKVFDDFVNNLILNGYFVRWDIVNCKDYGIPQNRQRLVLLASRLGEISLVSSKNYKKVTVKNAIGNLPSIEAGTTCVDDILHRALNMSKINIARIKQSKPGGSWKDWEKRLLPKCYRRKSGRTYTSVYGRMGWDDVAPTITTEFYSYGTGRFGHPEQNRAITLREGALLQTFPKNYKFVKDGDRVTFSTVGRQIGNAVPVKLGIVIGKSILRHLEENKIMLAEDCE